MIRRVLGPHRATSARSGGRIVISGGGSEGFHAGTRMNIAREIALSGTPATGGSAADARVRHRGELVVGFRRVGHGDQAGRTSQNLLVRIAFRHVPAYSQGIAGSRRPVHAAAPEQCNTAVHSGNWALPRAATPAPNKTVRVHLVLAHVGEPTIEGSSSGSGRSTIRPAGASWSPGATTASSPTCRPRCARRCRGSGQRVIVRPAGSLAHTAGSTQATPLRTVDLDDHAVLDDNAQLAERHAAQQGADLFECLRQSRGVLGSIRRGQSGIRDSWRPKYATAMPAPIRPDEPPHPSPRDGHPSRSTESARDPLRMRGTAQLATRSASRRLASDLQISIDGLSLGVTTLNRFPDQTPFPQALVVVFNPRPARSQPRRSHVAQRNVESAFLGMAGRSHAALDCLGLGPGALLGVDRGDSVKRSRMFRGAAHVARRPQRGGRQRHNGRARGRDPLRDPRCGGTGPNRSSTCACAPGGCAD